MTLDIETESMKRLPQFRPAQIRERAEMLRERSRECAELAADCLTPDARKVLEDRARELAGEAEALEETVLHIRDMFFEGFEAASGETMQN